MRRAPFVLAIAAAALALHGRPAAAGQASDEAAMLALLRARALAIPVDAVRATELIDTYRDSRDAGARAHEAIDIGAPRGTPVIAVEDGRIARLFLSRPGGITVYQFDPAAEFAYYYAHLDRYAEGLKEGARVRRGDVIGYVGSSGNAASGAPHLHFAVYRLGPERRWWRGTPINPFAIWRDPGR